VDCVDPFEKMEGLSADQHWSVYHYCFGNLGDVVMAVVAGIVPLVAPGGESSDTRLQYNSSYNWRMNWCLSSVGLDVIQTSAEI
jgi:hypothetical protein